jgi:hypothetical protein
MHKEEMNKADNKNRVAEAEVTAVAETDMDLVVVHTLEQGQL